MQRKCVGNHQGPDSRIILICSKMRARLHISEVQRQHLLIKPSEKEGFVKSVARER